MSRYAYYSRAGSYSRSYNAEIAETEGRYPLTRAVPALAELVGITRKRAREILTRIGTSEWHHVGRFAARVDYYDVRRAARIEGLTPCPSCGEKAPGDRHDSDAGYRCHQCLGVDAIAEAVSAATGAALSILCTFRTRAQDEREREKENHENCITTFHRLTYERLWRVEQQRVLARCEDESMVRKVHRAVYDHIWTCTSYGRGIAKDCLERAIWKHHGDVWFRRIPDEPEWRW